MEKLHNTLLGIKLLRRVEVMYPNIIYKRFLPRLRRRLEKHAITCARNTGYLNRILREKWIAVISMGLKAFGMTLEWFTEASNHKG
jgi:hypothetical protein